MKKKEKFYVFLDIDGVLWDWQWLKAEYTRGLKKQTIITVFNPNSISALNFLLATLEKNYDCQLVISSTWRYDMQKTNSTLRKNGLKYDKELLATPTSTSPEKRSYEILDFLNGAKTKNLLIIDDESFDYSANFSIKNIIKTNIANHSLNKQDVLNWLSRFQSNTRTLE